MNDTTTNAAVRAIVTGASDRFRDALARVHKDTDALFAWLMVGQWLFGVIVAVAFSPYGWAGTRHVVAVAQMLWSALLIHLTGGRIETHFHVFGSLAFLAFYRDWKVLVTATVTVAADGDEVDIPYGEIVRGNLIEEKEGR